MQSGMNDAGDRNFHLVMGALLAVSLVVDQQQIAGWRAGDVSMVSLVLAMVWLGRYAMEGFRRREASAKVMQNRLHEIEARLDEFERRERARRGPV